MTILPQHTVDDELLCAYLDGRLPDEDRRLVEATLAGNPDLAASLAALRYTKGLLAQAPRLAAPRPFTLSEAMLGGASQRRGWLAWLRPAFLRSAAALAAVMLLVLLVGDLGTRWQWPVAQPAAQVEPSQGGLAPSQGDPTAIIAKASTSAPAAATGFLGLPAPILLALELGLAVLLVLLLATAWRLSRAP